MTLAYPASGTLRDGLWIKKVPSKYTPEQVAKYLSVVGYEPSYDAEAISSGKFPTNLETLARVTRLHMLTFPFENTAMHYTAEHAMDVTPEGLYDRFVNKKHGSYCFGQNSLMLEILRGLGFRAYVAGGRVNPAPTGSPVDYMAATHLVILVQPIADSNQTYLSDVGFGSSCVQRPILLSNHPDNVIYGLSETERHRLTWSPREDSSLSYSQDHTKAGGEQWHMEVRHQKPGSSEGTWRIQHSFTEPEYWLADVMFGSFGVCYRPNPQSVFWAGVLCLKLFTIDEGNLHLEKSKRPIYRITLFGKEVWKSVGSDKEVLRVLETEVDRIRAIREFFGIDLKDEDAVHMVGRAAAYATSST